LGMGWDYAGPECNGRWCEGGAKVEGLEPFIHNYYTLKHITRHCNTVCEMGR